MKHSLLVLLASAGMVSAQTTITKAFNDPVTGETVNYLGVNGTPNNSASGSNATFNNSSLTLAGNSSTLYSTPTASEISTFPGSTLKMVGNGNTVYYKQSASKLEITGLVTPDATLNFSTNNGTFISYPAAYGYTDNDTAAGTFTASGVSGNVTGTITVSADASGTLILGANTYTNVLRIKSVQNFNLTIFGFSAGTIVNTSYSYYDNLRKYPLLSTVNAVITAQGNTQNTNSAQALNTSVLSTAETSAKRHPLTIYPNPAQDFIGFSGNSDHNSTVKIYSLDGKLIKTSDLKSGKVQVSDLPSAPYFIEVSGKNSQKPETSKFIKK